MSNLLQSFQTELYQALAKHDALTLIAIEEFSKNRNNNRPEVTLIETEYDRESGRLLSKLKASKEVERVSIMLNLRKSYLSLASS